MVDTKISAETAATSMRSAFLLGVEGTPLDRKFPSSLFVSPPQGRVTLTSATPILTSDATAQATIYYALYLGNLCPIYDGTQFGMEPFTELSLALDSTAAHTGYHQSGKNFDLFVINDAGTIRLVTGPAWSSDTSRGTGAGTTELELKNGIWTNKNSLANARFGSASGNTVAVSANQATYVGTFRATADGQTQVKLGSAAAGGGEAYYGIWNAYNRVVGPWNVRDTTDSWTSTNNTFHALNSAVSSGAGNRCTFVRGLNEDIELAHLIVPGSHSAGANANIGVGLDSSSSNSAQISVGGTFSSSFLIGQHAVYRAHPGIGLHYLQALEQAAASGTTTFWGDAAGVLQSGMTGEHRY